MTQQETHTQTAFILPPMLFFYVALAGLVVALGVGLTQPTFTIVGWAGLGVMVIALIAWAALAPQHFLALLRGRTARYGGTALLVTVVFLVALVAIYVVVRQQNWRVDLSERGTFSLSEDARAVLTTLAIEPETPQVRVLAFYGVQQAGQQERLAVLLDDFVDASGGKIDYEFINPDRNPLEAERYGVRNGQVVVTRLNEAGEPDVESAEVVQVPSGEQIANAVITVSTSGDFYAYFLSVDGGVRLDDDSAFGASRLNTFLTDRFGWTTQQISLFDFANLDDTREGAPDGEVLVIPGGTEPIPEEQLSLITEHIDGGGDVVLFASVNPQGVTSLATDPNLNAYLSENFGLTVTEDVLINPAASYQSLLQMVVDDLPQHPINEGARPDDALLLEAPRGLSLSETPPENVTRTVIARSGPDTYGLELDLSQQLTENDLQAPSDAVREAVPVGVAAENTATGAHLVFFASDALLFNQYEQLSILGIQNLSTALRALSWANGFDEFFANIPYLSPEANEQDAPVIADDQQLRNINAMVLALPFFLLALGSFVWWNKRERDI